MKNIIFTAIIMLIFTGCNSNKEMMKLEKFYVIGIAMESSNENEKSIEDMGKLWGRFYSEGITEKIPNKLSNDIYSIFTDYDSNYKGKYTAIIGHKVSSLEHIPAGMVSKEIGDGNHVKHIAKGKMPDAIVNAWKEIWSMDSELKRRYTADFEVYGKKSQQGDSSEVEIYLAVE
jgi:predicted transcriptional regulator YdeE